MFLVRIIVFTLSSRELADSAARRRRNGGNFLLAAEVDKLVAEETRTTSRLAQVSTEVSSDCRAGLVPIGFVLLPRRALITCSLQVVKTSVDKGGRGKYSGGQGTGGGGGHGNSGYSGGYAGGSRGGGRGVRLSGAVR